MKNVLSQNSYVADHVNEWITMMGDGHLHRWFLNNGDKIAHKWLHYFDIYERHFQRFRGQNAVVLEIGVGSGGSLQMWRDYFGPRTTIIGLDIDPQCKQHEAEGIEIVIGSQADTAILDEIVRRHPKINIVLDDGSHVMNDMIATFEHLYPRIDVNGLYLVEDLHTCYWEEYGGGLRRQGSFIELIKERIDDINAMHARGAIPVSEFTRSTDSMAIYDSVVVFEKRRQGRRQAIMTGGL
ncbi:limonene-1,2-epoxide hydrolase [Aminobacter lissarensis]|uniref:Limonene-1,2-epoxide hydrolase n=1 Tax=Aminobacter carboxidus TaxID=376165 RepID=A0A8E1WGI0_9HYPH|nr:class I SAM-dependent methyltransferase [Aminobacter lissarensis]MBB6468465.1 limonene-1,2-epoxide hydrolase [Aminobacter lissarensis]